MKLSTGATAAAVLSLTTVPATAFPNGAGSCAAGPTKFLPTSVHDGKGGGTLADGGLKVFLGNVDLDVGSLAGAGDMVQKFSPVGVCTGAFNPDTGFNLCENCQGDCDNSRECAPGLRCFQRSADEPVPGCYGLAVTDRDYCYIESAAREDDDAPVASPVASPVAVGVPAPTVADTTSPDNEFPQTDVDSTEFELLDEDCVQCDKCQGDCDNNGDCAAGLECFQRDLNEPVPGCYGLASLGRDYCYDPADGGADAAPVAAPEAAPVAAPTVAAAAPTAAAVVEEDVVGELEMAPQGDCDADNLCALCQGDCDDDTHCEDGLFCFQRERDEDVPGCDGRARRGVDYCISDSFRDSVRKLQEDSGGDAVEFQTTRSYTLKLDGMGNNFKGFLFRLSGADGQDVSGVFELEDVQTQIMASTGEAIGIPGVSPGACAVDVSGATHINNADRQIAEVTMTIPSAAAGELSLEVTAMINKDLWYATTYTVVAMDVDDMEVPEQTVPVPTPPPVAAPPTSVDAPTGGEDLPEGAVSFPPTGVPDEVAFKPPGECTGDDGRCMQCEGDCDNDAECGGGYVCYQRVANEPVPFCYGVALVDRDYCSLPVDGASTSGGTDTSRRGATQLVASAIVVGLGVMFV
mmetsp:Transcript_28095/g.62539  ORF Transcript_28095/g.62539 Transcript_28095/m.62539 type:complete len:633 (-) Transcript_28095:1481-3379(-)